MKEQTSVEKSARYMFRCFVVALACTLLNPTTLCYKHINLALLIQATKAPGAGADTAAGGCDGCVRSVPSSKGSASM